MKSQFLKLDISNKNKISSENNINNDYNSDLPIYTSRMKKKHFIGGYTNYKYKYGIPSFIPYYNSENEINNLFK